MRLSNRTPLVQTFLWWANVAVRVHDDYQAFFPPDVTYVADHAKRAMSTFPIARGHYYGVDYASRPPRDADLRWYREHPGADLVHGHGHDEGLLRRLRPRRRRGLRALGGPHHRPGKKLWTWGDHEFGYAWDRNLTDADGPYIELMAGVFTDNQPDFAFLLPGEKRTFSQYLYPLLGTGPVHEANLDAAVSLERAGGGIHVGVAVTRPMPASRICLERDSRPILERTVDLAPDQPFVADGLKLPARTRLTDLRLSLVHAGREVIAYRPAVVRRGDPPPPATEPPPPVGIESNDELYLTGLHLQQYRHATRQPEPYWREVLRRDPGDARANTALGEWHLRRGELDDAERHLRAALARLTVRNPNPRDGETSYLLGVVLRQQGELAAAADAFGKAGWNGAFGAAADTARAEIAALRGDVAGALTLLDRALAAHAGDPAALGLKAALLRRNGELERAREVVTAALRADPLDVRARHERALLDGDGSPLPGGTQTALDLAHDETRAGLLEEAVDALQRAQAAGADPGSEPMLEYTLAWLEHRRGDAAAAAAHLARARAARPDYAMPSRLEEVAILEWAMAQDPSDARAPYYLGNLLYDRRRYHEAIAAWRRAARLDPGFPTVHRNLGIAEFNVLHRPDRALAAYRRAFRAEPSDARVLYELDQLRKRLGHAPQIRLRALEAHSSLVRQRDDLSVEFVTLLNRVGRHGEAVATLEARRFHPWEGGEGLVSRQWVVAHRELARQALRRGDAEMAVELARAAMTYPHNLGEGKHLLTPEHELQLLLGRALLAAGEPAAAQEWLQRASRPQGDPDAPAGDGPYWQALALRDLGDAAAADALLAGLLEDAGAHARENVRIPYFATSLPTLLLFDDDLNERAHQEARYLEGMALLGLGRRRAARARFARLLEARPDHLEAAIRLAETRRSLSGFLSLALPPLRRPLDRPSRNGLLPCLRASPRGLATLPARVRGDARGTRACIGCRAPSN